MVFGQILLYFISHQRWATEFFFLILRKVFLLLLLQSYVSHVRLIPLSKTILIYQSFPHDCVKSNHASSIYRSRWLCAWYIRNTQQHFLTVLLILLLKKTFLLYFLGKFESSCTYKAVGGKVVISFDGSKLQEDNELRWTHNQRRIYLKKGSQVKFNELNIDQYGSLILENVQKDKSGEYKGIIYDAEGKLIKETVQQLCVLGTY